MRFDDRPDYDYLKRLFRELFFRKGFSYDNMYDWELLNLQNQRDPDEEHPPLEGNGTVQPEHKASDTGQDGDMVAGDGRLR